MGSEEDKYRRAFEQLDKDCDGSITPDEMALALRTNFSELVDSEFENMHKLATMGGSSNLNLYDFISFMQLMETNLTKLDELPARAMQLYYLIHDESDAVGCEELAKLDPAEHNLTPDELAIVSGIGKKLQNRGVEMIGFARLWSEVEAELQRK